MPTENCNASNNPWPYQRERLLNGYDLFDCEGVLQIQSLDDPEAAEQLLGQPLRVRHSSDAEALAWVRVQAASGNDVAADALEHDGSNVDCADA